MGIQSEVYRSLMLFEIQSVNHKGIMYWRARSDLPHSVPVFPLVLTI